MPTSASLSTKDQARLRHLRDIRFPCLLCSALPAEHAGLFFPHRPEVFGQAPAQRGKLRVFGYRLCQDCFALPGREQAVEARIQARLGAGRN